MFIDEPIDFYVCPNHMNHKLQNFSPEEVAEILRSNDDLGPDSSLWLRPMRQLLKDGKPLATMTCLLLRGKGSRRHPFGVLTATKNNRIIFWPVLPRKCQLTVVGNKIETLDHVTLELPSRTSHITAYEASGKSVHNSAFDLGHPQSWRLQAFEQNGVAIWFVLSVRWSVLLDQERIVQRRLAAPNAEESTRRKQEFERFAQRLKLVEVPLPASASEKPEYVQIAVYMCLPGAAKVSVSAEVFFLSDEFVNGWPDEVPVEVHPTGIMHEETGFVVATACPPGTLSTELAIGFPRKV